MRLPSREDALSTDEVRLIRRAQRGDRLALGTVLHRHERHLLATALVIVRSGWDAQDVVQEVMFEACAKLVSLRDPERFQAWLSAILVRKCYRVLDSRNATVPFDSLPEDCLVFIGSERDDQLLRAIAELPDEQRTAVALRYLLDLSYSDIGSATGWPEGTVKSRLHRGLRELRAALSKEGATREL